MTIEVSERILPDVSSQSGGWSYVSVLDSELSTDRAAAAKAKIEAEWAAEEAREKQAAEQAANMAEKKTRKKKREKAERSKLSFSFGDEDE